MQYSPKHITLIGPAHPLRGGLASFDERLMRAFAQEGHHTHIETFSLQYPSLLFPGKTQYSASPTPADLSISVSVNSINPLNWWRIGKRLQKARPDILITRFWIPFMAPCLGSIARIAKNNKHTKVISIIDNIIPHEQRIGDRQLSRYFTNSVDAFVCMSDSVQQQLADFLHGQAVALTPHPLFDNFGTKVSQEEALKKLNLDPTYKYVMFFGFIRDYKGLDLLLEAFAHPYFAQNNIKLLVAGEFYANSEKYLQQIEQLGITEQVVLRTEYIPNEQVADYFGAADIVAQTYKTATQSGVTQIAYHLETPMLVTNVGGLSEIVPHNKVGYVTEVDSRAIAEALIDFYTHNRHHHFAQNVIEEKQKYSWDKMTKVFMKLYEQL